MKNTLPERAQIHDLVAFSTTESYTVVAMNHIICCIAEGSYVRGFLNGRQDGLLIAKGLAKLEAFLPTEHFVRVHNNAIVNLRHIRKVIKGEGKVLLLPNGMEVAVSDRRWQGLVGQLRIF